MLKARFFTLLRAGIAQTFPQCEGIMQNNMIYVQKEHTAHRKRDHLMH